MRSSARFLITASVWLTLITLCPFLGQSIALLHPTFGDCGVKRYYQSTFHIPKCLILFLTSLPRDLGQLTIIDASSSTSQKAMKRSLRHDDRVANSGAVNAPLYMSH